MNGPHARLAHGKRSSGTTVKTWQPSSPPLQSAIERTVSHLLKRQAADGHWVGELQGDTILESEFILLMAFLGRENEENVIKAARYILKQQMPDGGWNNYPGGPADVSVSVKAYFALKLAGHKADEPYMVRAREVIRSLGGAEMCNSFTMFYMALLGQMPYRNCPAVPPEMMLLPRWCYFNIYAMSSWTRTIIIPLSIFYAHKPVRRLSEEQGIGELFLEPPENPRWPHRPTSRLFSWTNFFLALDQVVKFAERWLLWPIRPFALKRAKAWMLSHFADSDGLGAIYPPIIYTIICLRCLGYADTSPEMLWALKQLHDLMIPEGDTLRLQPCFSPVWDTALTLNALADTGLTHRHAGVSKAANWLLEHEVRRPGDWNVMNPGAEPAGWFFEYRNGFYPDTDDTAMVLIALAKTGMVESETCRPAAQRGVRWLMDMQNKDGGWAAFDRDIDREILTKVPFADHNAMLDPSCPDITARVLESLGHFGYKANTERRGVSPTCSFVERALTYLERTQEPTGAWPGRWGVNYIYGTWQVLSGLRSAGADMRSPMARKAVEWLKRVQQPGGGWGETCRSYDEPALAGQGTPTASQTAWALLGLLAAGEAHSPEVKAGIDFLLATQRSDGSWYEEQFTGTGFPKVFYLKYHMYALYFPLMALARFAKEIAEMHPGANGHARRPAAFAVRA